MSCKRNWKANREEVRGRLDNESSVYSHVKTEACTRDVWHRILVDLSGQAAPSCRSGSTYCALSASSLAAVATSVLESLAYCLSMSACCLGSNFESFASSFKYWAVS